MSGTPPEPKRKLTNSQKKAKRRRNRANRRNRRLGIQTHDDANVSGTQVHQQAAGSSQIDYDESGQSDESDYGDESNYGDENDNGDESGGNDRNDNAATTESVQEHHRPTLSSHRSEMDNLESHGHGHQEYGLDERGIYGHDEVDSDNHVSRRHVSSNDESDERFSDALEELDTEQTDQEAAETPDQQHSSKMETEAENQAASQWEGQVTDSAIDNTNEGGSTTAVPSRETSPTSLEDMPLHLRRIDEDLSQPGPSRLRIRRQGRTAHAPATREDASLSYQQRLASTPETPLSELLWCTVIMANYFWHRPRPQVTLDASLMSRPQEEQHLELAVRESMMIAGERPDTQHRARVENAVRGFLVLVDTTTYRLPSNGLRWRLREALREGRVLSRRELWRAVYASFRGYPIDFEHFRALFGVVRQASLLRWEEVDDP